MIRFMFFKLSDESIFHPVQQKILILIYWVTISLVLVSVSLAVHNIYIHRADPEYLKLLEGALP